MEAGKRRWRDARLHPGGLHQTDFHVCRTARTVWLGLYRGSKATLNQYMRSYAARDADDRRAMVLTAPGWMGTELGGAEGALRH